MISVIPRELLAEFSHFVKKEMGLYFPTEKWKDLERGACYAAKSFQFDDVISCIRWLMSSQLSQIHIETLAGYLTVGETYFFRDWETFRLLEENIFYH